MPNSQKSEGSKPAPITRRRSDETSRQLLALIFEGHFPPGSPLPPERELAETLRVSRPTLREALNKLEAKGLIERRSKSGNYVCTAIPPSTRDAIEDLLSSDIVEFSNVVEIRKVLELWAVSRATERADKRSLAALQKCLAAMKTTARFRTPEQFARHSEADLRFHQTIAEMTGNPIYVHLFHFLANLISRSITLSRTLVGRYAEQSLKVHGQLLAAIESGDPAKARKALLDHFAFVEKHLWSRRLRRK
ncbi:MAG: FadR family transcriptional regulator [Candidatus Sumerlaeia bacterium]|nr:FadR family transcriptional regulator [Candidatus Sumerlaeia bacterium]